MPLFTLVHAPYRLIVASMLKNVGVLGSTSDLKVLQQSQVLAERLLCLSWSRSITCIPVAREYNTAGTFRATHAQLTCRYDRSFTSYMLAFVRKIAPSGCTHLYSRARGVMALAASNNSTHSSSSNATSMPTPAAAIDFLMLLQKLKVC